MEKIEFKTAQDLYNRVRPALLTKIHEMNTLGFRDIKEKDLWLYLVNNCWRSKKNLQLYEITNDILNENNNKIYEYVMKNKIEENNHNDNLKEESLL